MWTYGGRELTLRNVILFYFLKTLFIFREKGREGVREGEKHQCVVPLMWPPPQACALTGNRTGDPSVHSPRLTH